MQNKKWLASLIVTLFFVGCAVGPKFTSPEVTLPTNYTYNPAGMSTDTLINISWWENFGDTTLTSLITLALDNNRNLAVAASRIEQARLQLKMTKSEFGPSVGLGIRGGATSSYATQNNIVQSYSIEPNISWDIDLFGKLRRMSESARAQMLSTEQGYRSVMLSLTAEVAKTYFNLLQYDMLLEISHETYNLRRASQAIIDSMFYYGVLSSVDLEQARSLTASVSIAIPLYERAKVQTEMALCALLGENPRSIEVDGTKLLSAEMVPTEVPTGLPTSLLNRRPDILQAYYQAASASAQVGVAVANRYPSLTLTGQGGLLSSTLKGLFSGNPFGWSASLSLAEPLFAFGRNKRAVEVAKEASKQAVLNYEQSVIVALGEVESILAGIASYRLQVKRHRELLQARQKTQILTLELYNNGYSAYLDVLDAERELFAAQVAFSRVLSEQLSEYVSLYKALGGGW